MALKLSGGKFVMNAGKLSCWCCCPDAAPTFEHQSRSASKSKCGFEEFSPPFTDPEDERDPNKRYLKKTKECFGSYLRTLTSIGVGGDCGDDCCSELVNTVSASWSGEIVEEYSLDTCTLSSDTTGGGSEVITETENCTPRLDRPEAECGTGYNPEPIVNPFSGPCQALNYWLGFPEGNRDEEETETPTSYSIVHTGDFTNDTRTPGTACDPQGNLWVETLTQSEITTLTDEYTTAALITGTEAALPEDWPNTTAGSFRSLSANELSYSLREAQWRATPPYAPESGRTFTLVYLIRFTPASGSPVDGAEQTLDFTTGDVSAWQNIPVPTENGTNTVVFVRWECDPS